MGKIEIKIEKFYMLISSPDHHRSVQRVKRTVSESNHFESGSK